MMSWQTILTALSLATSTMILLIGLVLLTGLFLPAGVPTNYRYTLGAVMTLYASYRIGIIVYKSKRKTDDHDPAETTEIQDSAGGSDTVDATQSTNTNDQGGSRND